MAASDLNELLVMIRQEMGREQQEPPEGYYPSPYWSKAWGQKYSTTKNYLRAAVKSGLMRKVMVWRRYDCGMRKVPYYGM